MDKHPAHLPFTHHDLGNQLLLYTKRRLDLALAAGEQARRDLSTPDAVKIWQAGIRQTLRTAFLPGPVKQVSGPESLGSLNVGSLVVEKIVYHSRPGVPVPALVYRRADLVGDHPGLLFLCGHEEQGKQSPMYQQACQRLALSGLVVFCPEIAGQGERSVVGLRPTTAHDTAGLAELATGSHLMQAFMEEASSALSVLGGLPGVDEKRLMVTGNSGGGLQAMLLALIDERVQATAVGTFLSSYQAIFHSGKAQDAEQVWPSGLTGGLCLDHSDLMAAFAPKPLLVLAASQDFFPIQGLRDSLQEARAVYHQLDAQQNLVLVEEDIGHQYSPTMAGAVSRFAAAHLGLALQDGDRAVHLLPETQLWALPTDEQAHPNRYSLGLSQMPWQARAQVNLDALYQAVDCCMDQHPTQVVRAQSGNHQGLAWQRWLYQVSGLPTAALLLQREIQPIMGQIHLCLWPGGSQEMEAHWADIQPHVDKGEAVLILDLPGQGLTSLGLVNHQPLWGQFGTMYFLNSYLLRTGQSLAGLATASLLQMARYVKEQLHAQPLIYAKGRAQLIAQYAQLYQPGLQLAFAPEPVCANLYQELAQTQPAHELWAYLLPSLFQADQRKDTP